MKKLYLKFSDSMSKLTDIPPLLFRLILAYGFYKPAMKKINNLDAIIKWFDSMGLPAPTLNAYLATVTEAAGVVLLALGLGTRLISIPLIFTMLVAIYTVHWKHGFLAAENGIQIPLYFMIMLISLLISGSGRISIDYLIRKNRN